MKKAIIGLMFIVGYGQNFTLLLLTLLRFFFEELPDLECFTYHTLLVLLVTKSRVEVNILYCIYLYINKESRGAEAQEWDCNATAVSSIPTRGIALLLIKIFSSSL